MARPAVLTVADTIAKSFLKSVEIRGDRPAIREKKFGIWQPTSWREWLQISKDIAYGLHATGFRPGDVASIIANAVPEWVFADMGILCAGGVSSGIYPTDSSVQVEYLINDSSTKVIFAEDEEQLDKILSCRARCPTLQKIVVFDMEGLSGFIDPMVLSLAEFMALGRNHAQDNQALWDEMIGSRSAGDLAILVYTSGTTGPPKGAMHSTAASPTRCGTPAPVSVERCRRASDLPAALPCRRTDRRLLRLAGAGIGDELRRKPGDGAGQSAGGAAHRVPGGAAGLGEILFRRHHRAEGCDPVPELDVSPGIGAGLSADGIQIAGRRRRSRCGSPTAPPTIWCSATSAACSVSTVAGWPLPARRRSRPI
jgi:hypothetical protein